MKVGVIVLTAIAVVASNFCTTFALRYTVHNTEVTFYEAWVQCIGQGGYLAAPQVALQGDKIWDAVNKSGNTNKKYWLAGTDIGQDGAWIWISRNVPVGGVNGYINWASGFPEIGDTDANCMLLEKNRGTPKWVHTTCDDKNFYVCEYYSVN
uniref:C-type lectin domain-containing protein n=1 Tax=Anopheles farauti TaxID=69004 RepID=A0A182QPT8_9DIPT